MNHILRKTENRGIFLAQKVTDLVWLVIFLPVLARTVIKCLKGELLPLDGPEWFGLIFMVVVTVLFLRHAKKWIVDGYLCVPGMSKYFTRAEIRKLFENETFLTPEPFRNTKLEKEILMSEHWIKICGYFLLKSNVLIATLDSYRSPRGQRHPHLYVFFYTGEKADCSVNLPAYSVLKPYYAAIANLLDDNTNGVAMGIFYVPKELKNAVRNELAQRKGHEKEWILEADPAIKDSRVFLMENTNFTREMRVAKSKEPELVLRFCRKERNAQEIAKYLGYGDGKSVKNLLDQMCREGKLTMSMPDQPQRRKGQKYTAAESDSFK